ncbi:hypothetical protein FB451DRAFT_1167956 [Mycena latifolia]|nr:hypothetical protein FB451DRAFT_1167956 [Mycena latifolia]
MSAHPPPYSTTPVVWHPKRAYIACVHCRKRKIKCFTPREGQPCKRCIKKGLLCDYLPVPEQQARSESTSHGQETADYDPPPPTSYMAPAWNYTPQEVIPSHLGHTFYYPPQDDSQFNSVNFMGMQNPLAHDPTADSSHQQPLATADTYNYQQYFANFGLNDASDMYCVAPGRARQEDHATVQGPDK